MPQYADILVPLALPGTFTYVLPDAYAERVRIGSRVVVQFGPKRFYTGIVTQRYTENPKPDLTLKEVSEPADPQPIVTPEQIALWQWMSGYYMCTPGEVMKAALPSGLKPESETLVTRNAEFDEDSAVLSDREWTLLKALKPNKGTRTAALAKETGIAHPLSTLRRLMDIGAIQVYEALQQRFKPHTELYVRLTAEYTDETRLNTLFDEIKRAKAREALLLRYLDLAEAPAALKLHNRELLKTVRRTDLCATESQKNALTHLRKSGILEVYAQTTGRTDSEQRAETRPRKELAEKQQQAHDRVVSIFQHKDVCLLHGVTSSGKTEVYMALIEEMLAQGKQVLYLVPEIALTTQLTTRLGRVFGDRMGVYHSKFPDAERVELWQRQLGQKAFPLILGVRSSLFLPFKNLGLVIVDEEHETSYKQQDPAPRYHARDTAIVLAKSCGAKVLLGTATPAVETYHNAMTGKYGLVEMPTRYGNVELPEIVVEDVKELRRKKLMSTPFSPRLTDEVRTALKEHEQAILFQNRRGYSPVMECRTCGWTPRCTRCDVSLTLHRRLNRLVCHYCGAMYDLPKQCPNCNDTELRDLGYGTEKIEQEAQAAFPEARTERMDLDTTRTRTAYENIINRFQHGNTDLLIGTQMVTKGLDFEHVRVVGIINADQLLNLPDFRAHERAYQMLSQVAGRAGRRGRRGLVVLQTRQPNLPVVQQIVRGDYAGMYRDQTEEREAFGFPPACRLINVYIKHRQETVVAQAAETLAAMLRPHFGNELLGPDRPVVSRVQLLYIRKLVIKVAPHLSAAGVRRTLWAAHGLLLQQPAFKSALVYFDVDP